MRTTKSLFLTLLLGLFSVFAFAQLISGTMDNTAHDFDAKGWTGGGESSTATGGTCIVCHIAHNSASSTDAPLWNRAVVGTPAATYQAYTSTTFNADDGTIVGSIGSDAVWQQQGGWADYLEDDGSTNGTGVWTPNGSSVLCLTCHDGVGNLDAFGGSDNTTYSIATGGTVMTNALALRNDGRNEHPYSFTYSAGLVSADGGLRPATDASVVALVDSSSRIQCNSCHDVHNSADVNKLLVMSNASSNLCRQCHTK